MDKSSNWYVATSGTLPIVSGNSGSVNLTMTGSGGYGLFVANNGDMYYHDRDNREVTMHSLNTTSSNPVMYISEPCESLFIASNNTLYCSTRVMHQVVTKSLDNPTNALTIVAGTGCAGSASGMLNNPNGIFVTLDFSLNVADTSNDRIQHFAHRSKNATTVAGNGTPGSINLRSPMAVSLDGNEIGRAHV